MGFKIQHGSMEAITKLGTLAGEAKATVRNQQIAAQMAAQVRAEAGRKELAMFQTELAIDKEKRGMAWEAEKIELYQRNKFDMAMALDNVATQKEYQEEERKKDKLNLILEQLRNNDTINKNTDELARFEANAYADIYGIQASLRQTPPKDDISSILKSAMAPQAGLSGSAVPPGLSSIWNNLSAEDKASAKAAVSRGISPAEIMKRFSSRGGK